jgi:chorismate mutase
MIKRKNNSIQMREIRKRIDEVDSKILPLMVKRSMLVGKALDLKTKKSEIVDTKRIEQIKRKVALQSKKLGGNPKLISKIWVSIIENFIDFEKRNFNK